MSKINYAKKHVRLGTRGSPLALKQVEMVVEALKDVHPDLVCETVIIKTSGDWKPEDGETPLSEDEGGKGQFAKEIEQALLNGDIDCGIHSAKDMPAILPEGLQMEHFLPRHDPRDALLCDSCTSIYDLKQGAIIGTCSPRRAAFLLHKRPDLKIVPLRGNVHTRIMKLCSGKVDATLLALAGLNRLGLAQGTEHGQVNPISVDDILPSAGQGAVGIEIHEDDQDMRSLFDAINCMRTAMTVLAERTVLEVLNGSCHTPIGVYGYFENNAEGFENCKFNLKASLSSTDGSCFVSHEMQNKVTTIGEAKNLGESLGKALKDAAPPGIL